MAIQQEKSTVVTAFVFDFETGGLDCTKSGAVQISIHAVRLDTFEVMEKLNRYIKPYRKHSSIGKPKKKVLKSKYDMEEPEEDFMEYSDAARKVHGVTVAMQEELGGTLEEVCDEIIDFVSRNTFNVSKANMPFFIGQNPWFDEGFLEQIFLYTGKWEQFLKLVRTKKDFWGNAHIVMLDTILLSQLAFNGDPTVENWKLEASALRLGIDLDDAHDADADVTATGEIVRVLTARMRNASADGSGGMMAMEKKTKLRDHFKI